MRARLLPLLAALALTVPLPGIARAAELPGVGLVYGIETGVQETGYVSEAQHLINQAMGYLGIPYRFGGTSPETGLDCSGLVQNVFRNALGLDLPRTAREMARLGNRVTRDALRPGDLVFFNTMRRAFSHVGIYLGDGRFVHAPARGGAVRVDSMKTGYWTQRFSGARRLVDNSAPAGKTVLAY